MPIHKRNLGLVFQNYALFPHKTVAENVAFGLKYRDVPKSEIPAKVQAALELVQLPHVGDRYPKELSGGQQQRIALARAIVIEPDVLLLDEPLSALDANLREDMRVELKRIQERIGVTTVFVTHDQSEALAMSDLIVVMSEGRVEQVGAPEEVYNTPASEFVANFLGASNIMRRNAPSMAGERGARGADLRPDQSACRQGPQPHRHRPGQAGGARRKAACWRGCRPRGRDLGPATVETVDYQGQAVRYFVRAGEAQLQAINMIDERPFAVGDASICTCARRIARRFRDKTMNVKPSHLFYQGRERKPVLDQARGVYMWDVDGKRYLDGSSGAMVCNIGHSNENVLEAMRRQMEKSTFGYRLHFETEASEKLAAKTAALCPEGLNRVFFVSGGSEAVESALKLARQYALATGEGSRWKIISRAPSYHGCTLGALAITSYAPLTDPFAPMMQAMPKVPAPRAYLDGLDPEDEATGHHYADMLEAKILEEGPESVLAFVVEPIGGASTGALVPPRGLHGAGAGDLPPVWRAADPRRGDDRRGAHRQVPRLRALDSVSRISS